MERDSFATDKNEYTNSCQHAQICRSLHGKQSRLSPPQLPLYARDSNEKETARASQQSYAKNGTTINTQQMYSWEELRHRICPSNIGQDCMMCSQDNHRMTSCDQKSEHNDNERIATALDQGSIYHARKAAAWEDNCYCLPSLDEQIPPLTWHQSMAAGYIGLKRFNNRQGHEERSSDCGLAFLSCSASLRDDSHYEADDTNWHFDPLAYLLSLYTPQQIITLQQCNPGGHYNLCIIHTVPSFCSVQLNSNF